MMLTISEMEKRYMELANGKVQPQSTSFRDKCKGAIIGTVVGDALFQPIEFSSKLRHPWIDKMTKGGSWNLPKGYYTDDSSMMLCIMQGYLDNPKKYDVRNVAKNFVKWMDDGLWSATGHCFDIGSSCSYGLRKFKECGSVVNGTEHSRGCGGVMRYASSWMVGYAEMMKKGGACDVYHYALEINNIDHHNKDCIEAIAKITEIYNHHLIENRKTSHTSVYKGWNDASGSFQAYGCLETALWAFNSTNNFRDAVIASGNVGGDTDSVAAVCGGIAGSFYGFDAIPKEWVDEIFEIDKLLDFTDKFLDATIGKETK